MFPEIHVLREASGKDVRIAVAVIVVVVFFDGTARPAHCVMVPLKVEVVGFCFSAPSPLMFWDVQSPVRCCGGRRFFRSGDVGGHDEASRPLCFLLW